MKKPFAIKLSIILLFTALICLAFSLSYHSWWANISTWVEPRSLKLDIANRFLMPLANLLTILTFLGSGGVGLYAWLISKKEKNQNPTTQLNIITPSPSITLINHPGIWIFPPEKLQESPHMIRRPEILYGRDDLLEELVEAVLGGKKEVFLHGLGGVGKSALAITLSHCLEKDYPDAQLEVDMKGTSKTPLPPEKFFKVIIQAFIPGKLLPEKVEDLRGKYLSILYGKRVLILLDDACQKNCITDLSPPDGCLLILTSRNILTMNGASSIEKEVLPLDPKQSGAKMVMAFSDRVGSKDAEELARLCYGNPMGIKLVSSSIRKRRDLTVDSFINRMWDKNKRLNLTGLDSALQVSYELLEEDLQNILQLLTVFSGSFDQRAATVILAEGESVMEEKLGILFEAHWLEIKQEPARYFMHDMIRDFLVTKKEPDEIKRIKLCHAEYFLEVLKTVGELYQTGKDGYLKALSLIDLEWDNLITGHGYAVELAEENESAARLCIVFPLTGWDPMQYRLSAADYIIWSQTGINIARKHKDQESENSLNIVMGNAYSNLPSGDRSDNLRMAIECYQNALKYRTPEAAPMQYAMTQNNLGTAYFDLPSGDRSDNLRMAIECYQNALKFFTPEAAPMQYAMTQNNLSNAYKNLPSGDRSDNLRMAIECYQNALKFYTPEAAPLNYAVTQNNLGNAYNNLPSGDRSDNLRMAIECYQNALKYRTPEAAPMDYAMTQNNLGNAYNDLEQFQMAIQTLVEAGQYVSLDIYMLNTLGCAYDGMGDYPKAEDCYLQIIEKDKALKNSAHLRMALNNLGSSYGDQGEFTKGLEVCQEALKIAEEIQSPYGQMRCHGNLGDIYNQMGQPDLAKVELEKALDIWNSLDDQDPDVRAELLSLLGETYSLQGKLIEAQNVLLESITIYKELHNHQGEALASWNLGKILAKMGDPVKARELMQLRIDYERSIQHLQVEKHAQEMQDLLGK